VNGFTLDIARASRLGSKIDAAPKSGGFHG